MYVCVTITLYSIYCEGIPFFVRCFNSGLMGSFMFCMSSQTRHHIQLILSLSVLTNNMTFYIDVFSAYLFFFRYEHDKLLYQHVKDTEAKSNYMLDPRLYVLAPHLTTVMIFAALAIARLVARDLYSYTTVSLLAIGIEWSDCQITLKRSLSLD